MFPLFTDGAEKGRRIGIMLWLTMRVALLIFYFLIFFSIRVKTFRAETEAAPAYFRVCVFIKKKKSLKKIYFHLMTVAAIMPRLTGAWWIEPPDGSFSLIQLIVYNPWTIKEKRVSQFVTAAAAPSRGDPFLGFKKNEKKGTAFPAGLITLPFPCTL